ncbi:MAG: MarR family transcriptional regulator [Planctomycetota bacterium]|jgi:DNA-binding MarR family transcriptional regulator|nr:MarR family transcriptional regulator [Planctomycetota bacterium]
MPRQKTALHILMHIGRLLQQAIDGELRPQGLHHGQGRVLALLQREGRMTQADLARRAGLRPATVTNMLKPLEGRRLIKRTVDPKSNRALVVSLTGAGRKLVVQVEKAWGTIEAQLARDLAPGDRRTVFAALEGFRDRLGGVAPADEEEE